LPRSPAAWRCCSSHWQLARSPASVCSRLAGDRLRPCCSASCCWRTQPRNTSGLVSRRLGAARRLYAAPLKRAHPLGGAAERVSRFGACRSSIRRARKRNLDRHPTRMECLYYRIRRALKRNRVTRAKDDVCAVSLLSNPEDSIQAVDSSAFRSKHRNHLAAFQFNDDSMCHDGHLLPRDGASDELKCGRCTSLSQTIPSQSTHSAPE